MPTEPELNWETPPPSTVPVKKESRWAPIAKALKANPGKWARVVTQGNIAVKGQAERGELSCFKPAGSFEGRCVNFARRYEADVYLRYIGENGEYKDVP